MDQEIQDRQLEEGQAVAKVQHLASGIRWVFAGIKHPGRQLAFLCSIIVPIALFAAILYFFPITVAFVIFFIVLGVLELIYGEDEPVELQPYDVDWVGQPVGFLPAPPDDVDWVGELVGDLPAD